MAISFAIKKYNVENFQFIIIEENVDNDKLDEREIYWIEQKDSFLHGYNNTRGGKSHIGFRIKYPMDEIVDYYISNPTMSCRDVAKHFDIFHETVSNILKEYHIPLRTGKNPITLKRNDEIYHFDNYKEAA